MPIAAILSIDADSLGDQWHPEGHNSRHENHIAWYRINKIMIFKRDLFSYDLICMTLLTDDGSVIETDEEDPNLKTLTDAVPIYLPGALRREDWFSEVAFPPFATQETTIYARNPMPEPHL